MADSCLITSTEFMTPAARENLFGIKTVKGRLNDGTVLQCWDPVDECSKELCPAFDRCPYKKKGICKVQREYMRGIHNLVLDNFADKLTTGLIYRIGQHLFPLYRTLIRLNIEELGVERIVTTDDKGMKRINPIYREIRETIKQIEFIWKQLGLTDDNAPQPKNIGDDLKGNPDYYSVLEKDANRRKSLIKRKKPLKRKSPGKNADPQ